MKAIFTLIERFAAGPCYDPLDRPLLDFGDGHKMNVRAFFESLLVVASVGKGKSTLAKTPCLALLRDNWGGLVLSVKRSQLDEFLSLARHAGREQDCIVIKPGGAVFNPLEGEANPNEAAALVSELADVLAGKTRDGENDAFWRAQLNIILKNLFTLWRKNREIWKEISARTGVDHKTLREAAAKLKKTELLGCRDRADWDLIKKLYKQGKSLAEIATEVGFTSGHSLSANITQRRKDGRWHLPKRPHIYHPPSIDKRSPC